MKSEVQKLSGEVQKLLDFLNQEPVSFFKGLISLRGVKLLLTEKNIRL